MMQITASVVRDDNGMWAAEAHIGEHLVLGDGHTREEAIASLSSGIRGWLEYMNDEGKPIPDMVTLDIAA